MKPGQKVPKVWRGKLRREERNPQRGELEEEVLGSCPGPGVRRQRGPACLKAQQNKLVSKPIWDTSAFKKYSVSWIVHSSNWSQTLQHRMTALTDPPFSSVLWIWEKWTHLSQSQEWICLIDLIKQRGLWCLSGNQGWEVQPWPLRRLTPPQLTNKIKNGNETQAGWCWVFRLGFTREFSKDSFCLVISVSSLSHPDSVSPYVYIFIHLSIYCGSLMTVDLPKINKYMEEMWVSSGLCLINTPHRLRVGITCWKWVKPNNLFPIPMSHSQPC